MIDFRDSRLNRFGVKTRGRGFTQNSRVPNIKKVINNQNVSYKSDDADKTSKYNTYKQVDHSFRNNDKFEDVVEANELDEFDLPVRNKSGRKIKIKT